MVLRLVGSSTCVELRTFQALDSGHTCAKYIQMCSKKKVYIGNLKKSTLLDKKEKDKNKFNIKRSGRIVRKQTQSPFLPCRIFFATSFYIRFIFVFFFLYRVYLYIVCSRVFLSYKWDAKKRMILIVGFLHRDLC
jgi:hypothetical protein